MPRLYCPVPLQTDTDILLDDVAARHVQVLRLQPGSALTLFDGRGGQYEAQVVQMGRREVQVRVGAHQARECETRCALHLAVGIPANDRMDTLVEKACELGAASIQPLMSERSVLRLSGERALKKQTHWQAIAVAACEQSGRNRVPWVFPVRSLADWLAEGTFAQTPQLQASQRAPAPVALQKWVLSFAPNGTRAQPVLDNTAAALCLSGPEGGLSAPEEEAALLRGFQPLSLGPRTLRADTAPLAALAILTA